MRHENEPPADRRSLATLSMTLAVALVSVGLLAAIMGTGRAIDWIVTDLLPMVVLLGVVFGVVGLLVRGAERSTTKGTNGNRRTSENPLQARLAELLLPALG